MEHQDWKTVGWNKPKPTNIADAKRRGYSTQVRSKSTVDSKTAKVDKTEIGDLKKVSKTQARAIIDGRVSKKLNQKQLATLINEKTDVVKQYEMGKAIVDHKIMNKFRRALGITL